MLNGNPVDDFSEQAQNLLVDYLPLGAYESNWS